MADISKKRKQLFGKGDITVVDENSNRLYVESIVRSEYATELPRHIQDKIESSSRSILDRLKRQKEEVALEGPTASAINEIQDRKELVLSSVKKEEPTELRPQKEYSKWKLMRVIAGHTGWVRSLTVEPENNWFASGAGDGTIKIWDMASGRLKLTLTGHIMSVRGLVVSDRHPYMFSCSEDKTVKCWDLEKNKVVRDYHGHLSSVYAIGMHPSVDLLVTGGRDSSVRVWDIRTKNQVHCLTGHKQSVTQLGVREDKPEIVSTSMDSTVRLWDMAAGKSMRTLTHHSKAVRGLALHEGGFVTASAESIKSWDYNGEFVRDMANDGIVNTLSVNPAGVVFSGGDNGKMGFYDLSSGYQFQETVTQSVPGSIESERGVLASVFDRSGMRLITGESDKSIKVWREC